MSVKIFFQSHGRFPTTDEFRLIRTFKPHQPNTLSETVSPNLPITFQFVRAARQGDLELVKQLLPKMSHVDVPFVGNQENRKTIPEASFGNPQASQQFTHPLPETKNSPTALCAAAQGDHIPILQYLLDEGAQVDARPSQNRTALLFASESGHFNSMYFLISRGATYFTYSDQQIESYYMSFTIRQSITRRELSYVLPGDLLPGIVLDYLGLGGNRTRPIERLAPVNIHNKTSFGAKPIPDTILAPIPPECQVSLNAADAIVSYTEEEWATESKKLQELKQNDAAKQQQKREEFVQSHYDPQRQNKE